MKEIVFQCNMVKEQTQCMIIYDIYYYNIIGSSFADSLVYTVKQRSVFDC